MNILKKSCSPLLVALILTNTVDAKAEYHVVQPGEVLSVIAEQKRVQSGFVLSTEQIMLTLYQLNKNVFVNGDINQLIIASKILIPDNTTEYLPLSKAEAQKQLQDKSYLNSQSFKQRIPKKADTPPQGGEYAQVLAAIDGLKAENKRLASKFNLIERALGRMVAVQGALTNEVVQIKTKIAAVEMPPPVIRESKAINDSAVLNLDNRKMTADSAMPPAPTDTEQANTAEVPKPALSNVATGAKDESLTAEQINAMEATAPTLGKPVQPVVEATVSDAVVNKVDASADTSIKRTEMPKNTVENPNSLLLQGAMVFGALFVALAAWWGNSFYRARRKNAATIQAALDDATEPMSVSVIDQYHFDGDDLNDEVIVPVKAIIEKSQQAAKGVTSENELEGVLELLDMCLLCGDYEQARKVTVKALAEHKSSAILAQKLSVIERKMAAVG